MISTPGYLIAEIQGGPDRPWALAGWLAGRGWYVRIMWTRDNRPLIATRMLILVFFMMLRTPMSLNMITGATWFSRNLNNDSKTILLYWWYCWCSWQWILVLSLGALIWNSCKLVNHPTKQYLYWLYCVLTIYLQIAERDTACFSHTSYGGWKSSLVPQSTCCWNWGPCLVQK